MSRSLRNRFFGTVVKLDDLAHEVSRGEWKQVTLNLVTAEGISTDWVEGIGRRPVLQLWARSEQRNLKLAERELLVFQRGDAPYLVVTPVRNPFIVNRIIYAGQYLVDRGIQVSVEGETFAQFVQKNQTGVERR